MFYAQSTGAVISGRLVGGQLRGDKECPFSGVTKSSRIWRKAPESDAGSAHWKLTLGENSLAAPGIGTGVSIEPGFSVGRSAD